MMAMHRARDSRPMFLYETLYKKEPEFQEVCSLIVWHGLVYFHGFVDKYIG
jgi:hypothetical protein